MATKRKAAAMSAATPDDLVDPSDELMFLCLGGGNEVGRSCHVIQYKGKTVMVSLLCLLVNPWSFFQALLTVA
jgi:cleavage and polyadenylation specificity factor subunit 3